MKTVIVAGALANKPNNGGEAWVRLSWARGFQKLGFRVCFIEQVVDGKHLEYFKRVTEQFGLAECAALVQEDEKVLVGPDWDTLEQFASSAQLLVNISGHLKSPRLISKIRNKAYIDIDPGYTQMWHEQGVIKIEPHDFYFTIAPNIGQPGCAIPAAGIDWRPIRQPVVLDDWPVTAAPKLRRFTTVAAWRGSFGTVHYHGQTYGQKAHEFRKFIELPQRAKHAFEIALQIHDGDHKDRDALLAHGWTLADPQAVTGEPKDFRKYVQQSSAEFSVAQGMYVATKSGWFSDRTVRYLASGRPALIQSTGDVGMPCGEGVIQFVTVDEAIEGANRIMRDYSHHATAARRIAEEYFDSDKVLTTMLSQVGIRK